MVLHCRYFKFMPVLHITYLTFLGRKSYLTQCWKPLPLIFMVVMTREFPRK